MQSKRRDVVGRDEASGVEAVGWGVGWEKG